MKKNDLKRFLHETLFGNVLNILLAILLGFVVGAIALAIGGYNPIESYGKLFSVIFGSPRNLSYSFIEYATPYILTGLSVAFSFSTGVFNIGAEGQYVMGSVAALLVGHFIKLPMILHIPLCMLAAAVAGGLWGMIVALLKQRFGANEILTMIMFNWIAYYFSNYVVNLKSVIAGQGQMWSKEIQESARITLTSLTKVLSNKVHYGIVIAIVIALVINYVLNKTTFGFKLKAIGRNQHGAEYAGYDVKKGVLLTLIISGALAGLAGGLQIMGVTYKITQFTGQEGYGFQGITVALIGASNPIGVIFSGMFFGAMKFGGTRFKAPSEIVDIIMGCIVLFIAIFAWIRTKALSIRKGEKQ
ncbi:MAG: ABC transporter permease [Erysipelotrichaceae bacterium]|nr:ABC transporter permease [Erysipelotrichaceae bacterium]